MDIRASVPLAPLTTFHIGGPAHAFVEVHTTDDALAAVSYARANARPTFVLGAGSNLLISDQGFDGVVIHMKIGGMTFEDTGEQVRIVAGAGTHWDEVVEAACAQDLFGIENLAGIPGTLGGAVVQNIGAYGAELQSVFDYAEVIDQTTGQIRRITRDAADFAYRSSLFKQHPELLILRAALRLPKRAPLLTGYADLVHAAETGIPLDTPAAVANAVRAIRARKFPANGEGTGGSFFKNPIIALSQAAALRETYPDLPVFPQEHGMVKVPLAWILDHVLSLKGYAKGRVRLYEHQPLVIVSEQGALASEVDALANEVRDRVREATQIIIEREVETIGE
jgi:UDP-N-acetylmuramate dehydrogenase